MFAWNSLYVLHILSLAYCITQASKNLALMFQEYLNGNMYNVKIRMINLLEQVISSICDHLITHSVVVARLSAITQKSQPRSL